MDLRQTVEYLDLGDINYKSAWDMQTAYHQEIIQEKRKKKDPVNSLHKLLFCHHNPVYTLGKSGSIDHLLLKEEDKSKFEFHKINRGGDITYHGPGQLTVYPIFDLELFYKDVHRYVRSLEQVVIESLADFGIEGKRIQGYTGVWINDSKSPIQRKICAIGVHLSRWVSMHGLALNVNTNLSHFKNIIPCGITESSKVITSMQNELNQSVNMKEVKQVVKLKFQELFDYDYLGSNN